MKAQPDKGTKVQFDLGGMEYHGEVLGPGPGNLHVDMVTRVNVPFIGALRIATALLQKA